MLSNILEILILSCNVFYTTQKVLLISIDGFRWDFQNKTTTPNFDWIVKQGISAEYVRNVFPTITLPNHQSIITGLYPEHHGMVANEMYNKETKETFILSVENSDKWWNQSTPIWIENQLQGHDSGVCFWPGYKVTYNKTKPKYLPDDNFTIPYAHTDNVMRYNDRLDLITNWLKNDNVTFVALYIEGVDDIAHEIGPDRSSDQKLKKEIENADDIIGKIRRMLKNEMLDEKVDVIITGDHGHINLSYKKVIRLDKFVNFTKYADFTNGISYVMIFPRGGFRKYVYNKLKEKQESNHYEVYLKENIPERYHIKNNNRTGDILVIGEPGWTFITNKNGKEWFRKNNNYWRIGDHGFSNFEKVMNPAFYGFGPSLRKGYRKESVKLVDLYSLMCHLLRINPRKNDGDFSRVKDFLIEFNN